MNKFNDKVAVVTGAGSGIGQQLAWQLAARGARVSISDIDQNGLDQTANQISSSGGRVHAFALDVSQRNDVFNYANSVVDEFGAVHLVINNAGVGLASGGLRTTSIEDFEWVMGVNFSGVLYGTKAFLPILEKQDWGHIVNISSLFGLIGVPEQAAYNASKFAVRGLTEALRQELELAHSHISCTCVHPGGIKTNIARNARRTGQSSNGSYASVLVKDPDKFDQIARTTSESAANQILNAVQKNQRRLIIGSDAKLLDWVQRHFPNHYQRVFLALAKLVARD